jgi:hypothetical protein
VSLVENCYIYNFNSIILSKINIKSLCSLPKLKKVSFFFFISLKQYKKNIMLFYIIISLIFGGVVILKKKEVQGLQIFKLSIRKNKIILFLIVYINLYLPLVNSVENTIKKCFLYVLNTKKNMAFRLNYFSFPIIPEVNLLCLDFELFYNFISFYRFQIDFHFKVTFSLKDIGEFLLRLYRLPCKLKVII